ncbi:hypothetical protein LINPERPRIM_LOCUS6119 [Linum perenne]
MDNCIQRKIHDRSQKMLNRQ